MSIQGEPNLRAVIGKRNNKGEGTPETYFFFGFSTGFSAGFFSAGFGAGAGFFAIFFT